MFVLFDCFLDKVKVFGFGLEFIGCIVDKFVEFIIDVCVVGKGDLKFYV